MEENKVEKNKMEENSKDNTNKKQKREYTVIRKFNSDGLSFQKAMEQLLIMKLNNLDKS